MNTKTKAKAGLFHSCPLPFCIERIFFLPFRLQLESLQLWDWMNDLHTCLSYFGLQTVNFLCQLSFPFRAILVGSDTQKAQ